MVKNMLLQLIAKLKPKGKAPQTFHAGRGLILFEEASEAIRAENVLKKAGYEIKMAAPPHHLRKGCDLAVEFALIEQLGIERVLTEKENPWIDIVPVCEETLKPVEIVRKTDFGRWLMIRAANMKLTFDKETGEIVNISGGGCPDVPFRASEIIGNQLNDAPSPKELGNTVCAYALHIAFEESRKIYDGGNAC